MKKYLFSEKELFYIKEKYLKGVSISKIAKEFNVSSYTVRENLRKQKVKLLTVQEKGKLKNPRNSKYFNKIDSMEKAYWLGFLFADGGLSKERYTIRINLQERDREHLEKFLNAIGATNHKVRFNNKVTENKMYKICYISICDKDMCLDLRALGCINCKSLVCTFPEESKLPKEYYSHFIRGYFDGNGSLHCSSIENRNRYSLSICGSKYILETIKLILGKENLKLEDKGKYGVLRLNGNKQLKKVLKYIYYNSNSSIFLNRKKEKYEEFLLQCFGGELVNARCV